MPKDKPKKQESNKGFITNLCLGTFFMDESFEAMIPNDLPKEKRKDAKENNK